MAVVLRSTWEGWGSLGLTLGSHATPIKSPPFLDAFVYGTVTSLSSRAIEHMTPEEYPAIVVVFLKVFAPYALKPLLEKGIAIKIPTPFIHLENGIYLLALLDGETARKTPSNDSRRLVAFYIHELEEKYRSFFN